MSSQHVKIPVLSVGTITGNATLSADYNVYLATLAGAATATLPAADSLIGKYFYIKRTDAVVANLTVAAAGADTIDGAANYTLAAGEGVQLVAAPSGTEWFVISKAV